VNEIEQKSCEKNNKLCKLANYHARHACVNYILWRKARTKWGQYSYLHKWMTGLINACDKHLHTVGEFYQAIRCSAIRLITFYAMPIPFLSYHVF